MRPDELGALPPRAVQGFVAECMMNNAFTINHSQSPALLFSATGQEEVAGVKAAPGATFATTKANRAQKYFLCGILWKEVDLWKPEKNPLQLVVLSASHLINSKSL